MKEIRIGISGWTYPPWRGEFYPKKLPQRRELEYASRQVNSIEINGTFYGMQKPSSFQQWDAATPDDFVFSIKGSRYITHITRLKDPKLPLANFFASGILTLGRKLGPILWQLPPSFHYDKSSLENFFKFLPHDAEAASDLAHCHDMKIRGHAVLKAADGVVPRHALEVRHKSFENEEFIDLLREYRVALVIADTAGKWPFMEDVTSDFVYARLHGDKKLYASGYTEPALDEWARKVRRWSEGGNPQGTKRVTTPAPVSAEGRNVYVYFDNDVKTRAPFDAISLGRRFGLEPGGDL
ncbi:MAG: DUF72 domain-containing protein [Luteolibacter sp.]